MSRGFGALQLRILDVLKRRGSSDRYSTHEIPGLIPDWMGHEPQLRWIRARWRWYTVDLLDLVEPGGPRSERVSLHRAVHSLHWEHRLQIQEMCPHGHWFGGYENEYGDFVGGFDLSELSTVDPRWPSRQGRSLWFRLPPPLDQHVPVDDQMAELEFLEEGGPEEFRDFTEALDRPQAWQSSVGRYIRWLFCGPLPPTPIPKHMIFPVSG